MGVGPADKQSLALKELVRYLGTLEARLSALSHYYGYHLAIQIGGVKLIEHCAYSHVYVNSVHVASAKVYYSNHTTVSVVEALGWEAQLSDNRWGRVHRT